MNSPNVSTETLKSAQAEAGRADLSAVFRLAYISRASKTLTPEGLRAIEEVSGQKNAKADITGILVMDSGRILQVLEGEQTRVTELFQRIARDSRHERVLQVAGGEQDSRLLNCWSMVSGQGGRTPEDILEQFHSLYDRLAGVEQLVEITPTEVDLLKTISLFRSIPG
ncbi:MAG: BLUF domain-containing protein [Akkermansiaceae bacterium]|jgi:hypothetical protein